MILHMYNIILKAKQGSMTEPDLCFDVTFTGQNYERVNLWPSPVTGQAKKKINSEDP